MPAALRTPASLSAGTRPVAAIRSATSSASALIGGGEPPSPAPPGGVALPGSVPGPRKFGGRSMSIYPSFEVSAAKRPALIPAGEGFLGQRRLDLLQIAGAEPEGGRPRQLLGFPDVPHADDRAGHGLGRESPAEGDL